MGNTSISQTPQQPQQKAEIVKQAASVVLNVDKIDEIGEYISAIQAPNLHRNKYDTNHPFLVVPHNLKVLDLEVHMPQPSRIRKLVKFTDAESFIKYVNEFKVGHVSQLFVKKNSDGMSIMCVFDYDVAGEIIQEAGKPDVPRYEVPQWNSHVAILDLTYSLDYAELREHNDNLFDQEDFAEFVEENTHLFRKPTGADMFELAQDLKITTNAHFKSQRRLSNGQVQLEYVENMQGSSAATGTEVKIPTQLEMNCSIFEGLEPVDILAAFRFRKQGGSVGFKYKLMTKLQERDAHEEIRQLVANETELNPLSVSTFALKGNVTG